jgi:predicted cobalt transporter CbtA
MSMPGATMSRRGKWWIAMTAAAALVVGFNASRIVDAVGQLVNPSPSNTIIVVPEGAETV